MVKKFEVDLSIPHSDYEIDIDAKNVYFGQVDYECYIKINDKTGELIKVTEGMYLETDHRFKKFYINNKAGSGKLVFYASDYVKIRG